MGSQVLLFGAVGSQVVKFPPPLLPEAHQFLIAHPDGSVALVFPEEGAPGEFPLAGEERAQALPCHGGNRAALAGCGIGCRAEVDTGRHQVDQVGGRADPVLAGGDSVRPVGNEGRGNPAFVIVVLVLAEGNVVEMGPAPSDEDIGMRVARLLALIASLDARFGVSTVVGEKQDESVVQLFPFLEGGHQPAHVPVDLLDHGGVDGHHVVIAHPGLLAQGLPGRDLRGTGFRLPAGIDEAGLHLAGVALAGQLIPSGTVLATVSGNGRLRGHAREVGRDMGEVPEKGFVGGAGFVKEADPLPGPEIGSVPRRGETRVVPGKFLSVEVQFAARHPAGLVGEVHSSLIEIEAAEETAGGGVDLLGVTHVPLAGHGGEVAGPTENLRDGVALFGEPSAVARHALVRSHPAYSGLVGVEAGQERGPRGTAAARVIELGKSGSPGREGIEMRGGDLTPITADVRESHVIHHDEDDVGPVVRGEGQETGKQKGGNDGKDLHWAGERGQRDSRALQRTRKHFTSCRIPGLLPGLPARCLFCFSIEEQFVISSWYAHSLSHCDHDYVTA